MLQKLINEPFLLLAGRLFLVYEYFISLDSVLAGNLPRVAAAAEAAGRMPEELVYVGVAMKAIGSACIIFGCQTQAAALLLVVFTLVATVQYHDYWNLVADELSTMQLRYERNSFAKNIGMTGGLLILAAVGAGHYSVDAWLARRRESSAKV